MAIPGGWVADRILGQRRAVLAGGVLITLGHYCLAISALPLFYTGLILIVCGTGLLKPNISAIVGQLYAPEDSRRDAGFSLFYMGINLGAFISPLVCGGLGQRVGWHWGFGAAGVGMTFGVVQYVLGGRRLGDAGLRARRDTARPGERETLRFKAVEFKRIAAIGILFFFSTVFWTAFEQAGSSFNLFADQRTRTSILGREFPSSWFQSVEPIFIILLSPVFAWLWVRLGRHEPSSPAKFACGLLFVGIGPLLLAIASASAAPGVRVSPLWLVLVYLFQTVGELCLSPVGLSMVTKLAPPRVVGLMMGIWFLSLALGNYIAGWAAGFFDILPLTQLFGAIFLATLVSALVLVFSIQAIRRLMGGVH